MIAPKSAGNTAKAFVEAKPRRRDDSKTECWDCHQMGHRAGDPKCTKPKGEPRLRSARVLEREEDLDEDPRERPEEGSQYDSAEDMDIVDEAEMAEAMTMGQIRINPMRLVLGSEDDTVAFRAQRVTDEEDEDNENVARELLVVPENLYGPNREPQKRNRAQGEGAAKTPKPRDPWLYDSKLRIADRAKLAQSRTNPNARRVLSAEVRVNGVPAFVLFDSGSESDALSPDFARAHGIQPIKLETPIPLQLGCKGSRSVIRYGAEPEIQFGAKAQKSYVDIVNIDRYDLILGTPWLGRNRATLDFGSHSISVGDYAIWGFTCDEDASYRRGAEEGATTPA